jgi:hypothetical protein
MNMATNGVGLDFRIQVPFIQAEHDLLVHEQEVLFLHP